MDKSTGSINLSKMKKLLRAEGRPKTEIIRLSCEFLILVGDRAQEVRSQTCKKCYVARNCEYSNEWKVRGCRILISECGTADKQALQELVKAVKANGASEIRVLTNYH